jgi:hypothetical protein
LANRTGGISGDAAQPAATTSSHRSRRGFIAASRADG